MKNEKNHRCCLLHQLFGINVINLEEPKPVRIGVYQSDEVEKVVLHQSKPTSIFRKVLIGLGCCCLGSAGVLLYLFNEAMSGLASPLG